VSAAFLDQLGLGHHRKRFEAEKIDRDALMACTDADLQSLGVTALGERKKLLVWINTQRQPVTTSRSSKSATLVVDLAEKPHSMLCLIGHPGHGRRTLLMAIASESDAAYRAYSPPKIAQVVHETVTRRYTLSCYAENRDELAHAAAAVLVVSVADGPMPGTRDHLKAAREAGVPAVVVYLNKCDFVDDAELEDLVEVEVRELLKMYGYQGDETPIIRGSASLALTSVAGERSVKQLFVAIDEYVAVLPASDRASSGMSAGVPGASTAPVEEKKKSSLGRKLLKPVRALGREFSRGAIDHAYPRVKETIHDVDQRMKAQRAAATEAADGFLGKVSDRIFVLAANAAIAYAAYLSFAAADPGLRFAGAVKLTWIGTTLIALLLFSAKKLKKRLSEPHRERLNAIMKVQWIVMGSSAVVLGIVTLMRALASLGS
jgi:hypothetical protein